MISRIADHCFWFGRYLERTESTARVLHVTGNLALDADLAPNDLWKPVLTVAGEEARFFQIMGDDASALGEGVQHSMSLHADNPVSILQSASRARENARAIRDVVSLEVWHTVNELYLWLAGKTPAPAPGSGPESYAEALFKENRYGFYRAVRQHAELAQGLLMSTMLHDTPLDFIVLGIYLERAIQTARTLDMHHYMRMSLPAPHQVIETALSLSLLRACSGFEPFMKRRQGRVTDEAVAAFLVLEPRFPRSVRFCVRAASDRLEGILSPGSASSPGAMAHLRLRFLEDWLDNPPADALKPDAVHGTLLRIIADTAMVCGLISNDLLGETAPASQSQQA
ncbi:MAG: alpha-E domain-containing protein [Polyangiaceae bacterium]|nr:alpha-E domain-containing protein [Polyangiaceae bacterium]